MKAGHLRHMSRNVIDYRILLWRPPPSSNPWAACKVSILRKECGADLDFVVSELAKRRDDAIRAVKKLRVLGSGMEVVASGSSQFIYSIPGELSMDHTTLLQQAEKAGHLTVASTASSLGWTNERAGRTLDHLLRVGVAWRDDQDRPASYWFPAFFQQCAVAE
ncbi:vacuolar-sorting protein SNF8-like [Penaeus indicus]|uniref:vacuolar-sorting protein SNF8-like n=1 Tax=Penaeus indicus TaxID=29960 RepID=UPI00300CB6F0